MAVFYPLATELARSFMGFIMVALLKFPEIPYIIIGKPDYGFF